MVRRSKYDTDSEVRHHMGIRTTFEVPDPNAPHEHNGTLYSADRNVVVFHTELEASFRVPQWLNAHGHYVYFAWGVIDFETAPEDLDDEDDEDILYIGVTSRILTRIAQHSETSSWWPYATHIDIYQYADRFAAEDVERFSIGRFRPRFNSHYTYREAEKATKVGKKTGRRPPHPVDGLPPMIE